MTLNDKESVENLRVVKCVESWLFDLNFAKDQLGNSFEALYCLENYLDYEMGVDSSIKVTFERCKGLDECLGEQEIEE